MSGIRMAGAVVFFALQGCGSGASDSEPPTLVEKELTITSATVVNSDSANLSGDAFLTKDASCEVRVTTNSSGAPTGFYCVCTDDGSGRVTWKNTTTGTSGFGTYQVNGGHLFPAEPCFARGSRWSAILIPLVPGKNNITVSMQDSQSIGSASTTVTRN